MIFDVTRKGFDIETSATDHLVKWVKAPSREVLDKWLSDIGVTEHIDEPYEIYHGADIGFEDGVDVILTVNPEFNSIEAKWSPSDTPKLF